MIWHTHEYFVADNLPLAVGIGVEDGEAAAGVSEDQFGPWESRRREREEIENERKGRHHLFGERKQTD